VWRERIELIEIGGRDRFRPSARAKIFRVRVWILGVNLQFTPPAPSTLMAAVRLFLGQPLAHLLEQRPQA
jgi:hypothetical protein